MGASLILPIIARTSLRVMSWRSACPTRQQITTYKSGGLSPTLVPFLRMLLNVAVRHFSKRASEPRLARISACGSSPWITRSFMLGSFLAGIRQANRVGSAMVGHLGRP